MNESITNIIKSITDGSPLIAGLLITACVTYVLSFMPMFFKKWVSWKIRQIFRCITCTIPIVCLLIIIKMKFPGQFLSTMFFVLIVYLVMGLYMYTISDKERLERVSNFVTTVICLLIIGLGLSAPWFYNIFLMLKQKQ